MSLIFKDTRIEDVNIAKGIVTSYWSRFDNEDLHGDIIRRGAYAKTIQERGPNGTNQIKFLWMHNWTLPLGPVLHLEEDEVGLLAVYKIIPELFNDLGRDLLILYNERVLDEHSVGLDPLDRLDEDRRVITQIKLWEGSVVTWGANPLTPVVEMKTKTGIKKGTIETPIEKQIQIARRCLDTGITDRLGREIESWLKTVVDVPSEKGPDNPPQTGPDEDLSGVLKSLDTASALLSLISLRSKF